jgi:acetyltransferase-like isoleucine patch superfamily enzyme
MRQMVGAHASRVHDLTPWRSEWDPFDGIVAPTGWFSSFLLGWGRNRDDRRIVEEPLERNVLVELAPPRADATAIVDPTAELGAGTVVWGGSQIRENVSVGVECVVGRGVYIGPGVSVGARCKIQNDALVYEPATLGEGVFVGPKAIITNDRYPRAVTPSGALKSADDWTQVGVEVAEGASIGAGAICVGPIRIGRWAFVAAGAVVTSHVPDFALVAGVPARQIGWVGRAGQRLVDAGDGRLSCPSSGDLFVVEGGSLVPLRDG